MKSGKCEDRKCMNRHRKTCRYLKTKEGCYRNEACQYLHDSTNNNDKKEQPNKSKDKCDNSFECNNCDFKCNRTVTLKKHINTKHTKQSSIDSVSEFIFHLGCVDYAAE